MGNRNIKSDLRNAITLLNISADPIDENDDQFWNKIWLEDATTAADVVKGVTTQEVRMLRDGSPKNFALLAYKAVEKLYSATGTLCNTIDQQNTILNATRILTRLIPCMFEDKEWRAFFDDNYLALDNDAPKADLNYPKKSGGERDFKAYLPSGARSTNSFDTDDSSSLTVSKTEEESPISSDLESASAHNRSECLSTLLVLSITDLLFCPEFTVPTHKSGRVDAPPEDLKSISSCDYVWEPGVGFDSNINSTTYYDKSRTMLLQLLLVTFSSPLYDSPANSIKKRNTWLETFSSSRNRHALPLFTSLLNVIFIYNPSRLIPFNHLLFSDPRQELVELALQFLLVTLDYDIHETKPFSPQNDKRNLFIEYMSRIHRSEDFAFIIRGFTRLLNNRFEQGYIPNSTKHINLDQELLILFWRIVNLNSKFICQLLKTQEVLDIVVPILYHINENYLDSTRTALIHVGIFNLLILSGERNFSVRLNKPYAANVLLNLPTFTGTHADLLIIVFHKLILYGRNINQLFDFMVVIIANVSPYLKAVCMLASKCLIQLFEVFSSPSVIFTEPSYHQLVIFLLDIFNNLIQYQFDGNANLFCVILSHKAAFINLAKLPTSQQGIQKVLHQLMRKKQINDDLLARSFGRDGTNDFLENSSSGEAAMGTSHGYLATVSFEHFSSSRKGYNEQKQVSIVDTPDIDHMTRPTHPLDGSSSGKSPDEKRGENDKTVHTVDDLIDQTNCILQLDPNLPNDFIPADNISAVNDAKEPSEKNCTAAPARKDNESRLKSDESQEDLSSSTPPSSASDKSWRPSPSWASEWKKCLPLQAILRMIEVLSPQLERFKKRNSRDFDDLEVIKFLQNGTLVGLLPVPHPIIIRKYMINDQTKLWFRACTWAALYVRRNMWTDTNVKLIRIHLC